MSNYTPSTNFATKDALPSGDPLKIVKGTEINTEFTNIAVAVATKADNAGAVLTSPTLVTPALGTPASGNLTNCTFPTLNQNTTGNAATATNPQSGGTFITSSNIGSQSVSYASSSGTSASCSGNAATATTASNGGVTSVNGQTGAVVNTTLYAIGSYVTGRPQSYTSYAADSTLAGSSIYNTPPGSVYSSVGWLGPANYNFTPSLVNTGTWRCMSPALGNGSDLAVSGLWVRIS